MRRQGWCLLVVLVLALSASTDGAQGRFRVRFAARVMSALANTFPPLPQSVYDDFANAGLSTINCPAGDWYLPGSTEIPLSLAPRSNVTMNFAGCRLHVNPTDRVNASFYPIQVSSVTDVSALYPPYRPSDNVPTRYQSHLTGAITAGTTQLTMVSGERPSVQAGETVLIWAGVNRFDPVEAQFFIPATIAAVNTGTGVITFTAPLGVDCTNYGSLAALTAVVDSIIQYKVGTWGTWPDSANFSKGYGIDHGMERFVGGMLHDITINDLTMVLDPMTNVNDMPNGMWDVSAIAVNNFTMNRTIITNEHGNGLFTWRCFHALIDTVSFTGKGSMQFFNTSWANGYPFSVWGGRDLIYRNVSIVGEDMGGMYAEVSASDLWFDGFNFNVTFTADRTVATSPVIFGLYSAAGTARITNARLATRTTGGANPSYWLYFPMVSDGYLEFVGTSPEFYVDWGFQKAVDLQGTLIVNGVTYGPPVTATQDYTITHGAGFQDILRPGFYTSITVQLLAVGDLRNVSDAYGVVYWDALAGSAIVELDPEKWYQLKPTDAELAYYLAKYVRFWMNNAGSTSDATVRFVVTYLPQV